MHTFIFLNKLNHSDSISPKPQHTKNIIIHEKFWPIPPHILQTTPLPRKPFPTTQINWPFLPFQIRRTPFPSDACRGNVRCRRRKSLPHPPPSRPPPPHEPAKIGTPSPSPSPSTSLEGCATDLSTSPSAERGSHHRRFLYARGLSCMGSAGWWLCLHNYRWGVSFGTLSLPLPRVWEFADGDVPIRRKIRFVQQEYRNLMLQSVMQRSLYLESRHWAL